MKKHDWIAWLLALLGSAFTTASIAVAAELQGDIGMAAYQTRSIIRGGEDTESILPYADFNYGRLFARIDTFGVKTLPLGYGHLELIGRYNQDGFRTDVAALNGLKARRNSLPIGLGTLQVTPVGGFYLNAFHDAGPSGGKLVEFIYGARFALAEVTFYPMAGMEYRSGTYVKHFYGITAAESAASGYATYQPGGASNTLLALIADVRLADEYHLNLYFRRKWLGDAIRHSPIVTRGFLDTAYIALSYRY